MQKYLRAGPTKMLLGNWYLAGTNHFNQIDFWEQIISRRQISAWGGNEEANYVE